MGCGPHTALRPGMHALGGLRLAAGGSVASLLHRHWGGAGGALRGSTTCLAWLVQPSKPSVTAGLSLARQLSASAEPPPLPPGIRCVLHHPSSPPDNARPARSGIPATPAPNKGWSLLTSRPIPGVMALLVPPGAGTRAALGACTGHCWKSRRVSSILCSPGWELLMGRSDRSISPGVFSATAQDPRYRLEQPEILAAPTGGSITLPCTLIYPPEIEPLRGVRVYWRRGGFHGDFVYNHTEGFTRWDYRGRIALVGNPGGRPKRTASIRIDRLQASDTSEYVCQVCVQLQNGTWIHWKALPGTRLTVTAAPSPMPRTWHPALATQDTRSAERNSTGHLDTTHLALIGLASTLSKIGICIALFALCQWLGWAPGLRNRRPARSDPPGERGLNVPPWHTAHGQASPGNDASQQR
ncbi:paired immunoglobulin-like type 2 receptor beta isoform X2 [Pelodiscus sinensis]|uniref:paired immunoglobulin-like type 2 receptor beta isoform X2 n=1 Tax=Pelodiscus sinensis TaxID=13735 RepID=UPI003F6BAD3A